MRVPTTMTGIKPMILGPTTMMQAVNMASSTPASRELPPDRMKRRLLAYTR